MAIEKGDWATIRAMVAEARNWSQYKATQAIKGGGVALEDISEFRGMVDIMAYDAVEGGVVDNAAAITAAAADCVANGTGLLVPPGIFLASSQLDLREISIIRMLGSIKVDFAGEAILAGTASTAMFEPSLQFRVYRDVDWTGGNIGVVITNCYEGDIHLTNVSGFEWGAVMKGVASGFAYNTVFCQMIWTNKYGLVLTDGGVSGWCNENLFIGGRFSAKSGNYPVAGILITSGHSYQQNNNLFIKPCFELGTGPPDTFGIIIEHGLENQVLGARREGTVYAAKFENNSQRNVVELGYGSAAYIDTSDTPSNYVVNPRSKLHQQSILDTKTFMNAYEDKDGKVHVPGWAIRYYYNSRSQRYLANTKLAPTANYLDLKSHALVGIRVDTSVIKRFKLVRHCPTGLGGRVGVKCFDAHGNNLGGTTPRYVRMATASISFSYRVGSPTTEFGGFYQEGADNPGVAEMVFHDDVKSAFMGVLSGSANGQLSGIDIVIRSDSIPRAYIDYDDEVVEHVSDRLSGGLPLVGTYKAGTIMYNDSPSAGSPPAWDCRESGTMEALAATTGDTVDTLYILTDLSQLVGIVEGVYLDVAGVTSVGYVKKAIAAVAATTIDANSGVSEADPRLLSVAATTNFAVGESIIINRGGNNELRVIASIDAGVSLTLTEDMTNDYTNEAVENCVVMSLAADATVNDAAVTTHTGLWVSLAATELSKAAVAAAIMQADAADQGAGYVEADVDSIADLANVNKAKINDILTALKDAKLMST